MGSSRSLLIFIFPILLNLIPPITAQGGGSCTEDDSYCWICSDTGTYTPGGMYQENLNSLLSSFSTNTEVNSEFYSRSKGLDRNKVNAIALCRGDVSQYSCHTCLNKSTNLLLQKCSGRPKEAIIWAEYCMVRYSNNSIFRIQIEHPMKFLRNPDPPKNSQQFERVLNPLLSKLIQKAAGGSFRKFAAGHATVPGGESIYALVQCTPDINPQNCSNCLTEALSHIPGCCGGRKGGRVLKPSCNLRYEAGQFYDSRYDSSIHISRPPPGPAALAPSPAPKEAIVVVSVVVSLLVVSALLALGYCFFFPGRRTRKKNDATLSEENGKQQDMRTAESLQFDLGTLETATNKFSEDNKLGEGGFGAVFQGMLSNGQEIAVKRLSKSSGQGVQEFKNEVVLVAKLQHRNLVRLLGFCLEGEETLLVYEYVPNKSLDYFLFEHKKREQLDWLSRTMIIGGIARGILYLHEDSRLRVIHRDLKASNILLDSNMNPKISDFGMARMFGVEDQTEGSTKRIVGTYGYMAPEYAMEGLYSVKSDVFSFGVLLLEIITGRRKFLGFHRTNCAPTLIGYAWQLWNETKGLELMDPVLKDSCCPNEFLRYIHIGLLCVQEDANSRPTMSSVVHMLKSESISLSRPEKPAFFTRGYDDHHDQVRAQDCSANALTISTNVPR